MTKNKLIILRCANRAIIATWERKLRRIKEVKKYYKELPTLKFNQYEHRQQQEAVKSIFRKRTKDIWIIKG